ncbi:SGNH/GDSL hydrolase family protein [Sphingomonas sanguinis]|uniref:Uncharacterized protein n=1 Tax=Sphingomonas sanguinis TaxID=33051 RepID=A0A147HVB3_9SPHN|nr:SGNH/GDSL hydrolase family protein [Sphingomonas sanguinis]KTT68813.1 hypothetical protein NS319_12310 [Sphingomonas sanguinis]
MTVAAKPATISYIEDGVSVSFAVPFRFKAAQDLVVERLIDGKVVPLLFGIDYRVNGGATDAGGSLIRSVASSGAILRITRNTVRTQAMVYSTGDRFPAASHESALDRQMLIAQEQDAATADIQARALLVPAGQTIDDVPVTPNSVLTFDGQGAPKTLPIGSFPAGPTGRTGGNVMSVGLFVDLANTPIPAGAGMIRTSGYSTAGQGGAFYVVDDDQVSPVASATRAHSREGVWYRLSEPIAAADQVGAAIDAVTDDTASLTALDARGSGVLPEGTSKVAWGTRFRSAFRGISRKAKLLKGGAILTTMLAHAAGLHATMADIGWEGNLAVAQQALTSGSIRVAIVGDSIAQGRAQVTSLDASMVRVAEAIQRQCGRSNVIFANFSIAGRGAGELNSDAYTGKNTGTTDPANFNEAEIANLGYPNYVVWPGGTTVGQTWKAHIKAWAPQLLIIAVGINDNNDPRGFAGSLSSFLRNYLATWDVIPSVVLCTPYAPSYRRAFWDATQNNIAANAAAVRSLARELGHSLVDVRRVAEAMRTGADSSQPQHRRVALSGYPTGWVLTGGTAPINNSGSVTFGAAGSIRRNDDPRQVSRDGLEQFDVTVPAGQSYGIEVRIEPTPIGNTARRMLMQIDSDFAPGLSRMILYFVQSDGSVLAKDSGNFVTPANYRFVGSYRWIGGEHIGFCNGSQRIGVRGKGTFDYDWLYEGHFGQRAGAGVVVNSAVAELGYERSVGMAVLDDYDMFGEIDDFGLNEYSLGGNRADNPADGGNHPTIWGHYNVYLNAFRWLIEWHGSAASLPSQPGYKNLEIDDAHVFGAYDYFQCFANGFPISGATLATGVSSSHLANAPAFNDTQYVVPINGEARITATATTIAFTLVRKNLFDNSVNDLVATINVSVPFTGAYYAQLRGSGTQVGGTVRYNLFAKAEAVA